MASSSISKKVMWKRHSETPKTWKIEQTWTHLLRWMIDRKRTSDGSKRLVVSADDKTFALRAWVEPVLTLGNSGTAIAQETHLFYFLPLFFSTNFFVRKKSACKRFSFENESLWFDLRQAFWRLVLFRILIHCRFVVFGSDLSIFETLAKKADSQMWN